MLKLADIDAAVQSAVKDAKPSEIGAIVGAVVARELVKALTDLEARLDHMEREAMCFAGAFDVSKSYSRNDCVQRGNALWLALVKTTAGDAPGSSSSWRRIAESKV